MKKIIVLIILLISLGDSVQAIDSSKKDQTVFTLGSLHSHMLQHPQYTLKEFMAVLSSYQPDLILTETRKTHPGALEGSIDGGIEQGIVYAYGNSKNIKTEAVDWFDNQFILDQIAEYEKYSLTPDPELDAVDENYGMRFSNDSIFELHSESLQNLVREKYRLLLKNKIFTFEKRNEAICKNIWEAISHQKGKRILIVFGLDHKYYIDDCLREAGVSVLAITDLVTQEKLSKTPVDQELVQLSTYNISASKQLLEQRLRDHYYSDFLAEKLADKVQKFPLWLEALQKLGK